MSVSTVTVTWTEKDVGGTGLAGSVRFEVSGPLDDPTDGTTYEQKPVSFPIVNGTGQTTEPVIANDDPALPAGSWYAITISIQGQQPRTTYRYVNHALGATQTLASLPVAVPAVATSAALALPSGTPVAGDVPTVITSGSPATSWQPGGGGGGGGGFANPMTALGDLISGGVAGAAGRLAGNTAATRKFLRQTGTGAASAAPVWDTLVAGDIPSLSSLYDAQGAAASALTSAQTFATNAVSTETSRAEAAEALLAPLASPALTGTPTAPTKAPATNSTALATTAYTDAAVAVETTRAQAAEALALPLAGGTMSGAIAMGAHKVTGLANGSAAQDAAAFGQIPTALPPNGAAGGVLSGTYPNPGFATAPLPKSGGTMTGWLAPAVVALTFGASIALDASLGNAFAVTLTASTGILGNPSNPVDGQTIRVRVIQDATGSRTLAYGTAYDFGAAGAPTLSTGASKVDILGFEYVASLSKWCYLGAGLGF